MPALPIFNKAQYDLANTWIKPYINVPIAQMKPFTTGIFNQTLIPEPAVATQSVYHSLDAVVEAVLTDKNANVQSLLQQANTPGAAGDLERLVARAWMIVGGGTHRCRRRRTAGDGGSMERDQRDRSRRSGTLARQHRVRRTPISGSAAAASRRSSSCCRC